MLAEEADKFWARSIVCQLGRVNISLACKHLFKKNFALATPLHGLMHIKVEDAKRRDLLNLPVLLPDKQFTRSNFQKPDHRIICFIDF